MKEPFFFLFFCFTVAKRRSFKFDGRSPVDICASAQTVIARVKPHGSRKEQLKAKYLSRLISMC